MWPVIGASACYCQQQWKAWLSPWPSLTSPWLAKVGLLLQPGDGGSLGCALDLCWYGGGWAIVFKKFLSRVSNHFLKVFCLPRLSYSGALDEENRLLLGRFCLLHYLVLSSSAYSQGCLREKEIAGSSPAGCSSGADACSHSSFLNSPLCSLLKLVLYMTCRVFNIAWWGEWGKVCLLHITRSGSPSRMHNF